MALFEPARGYAAGQLADAADQRGTLGGGNGTASVEDVE